MLVFGFWKSFIYFLCKTAQLVIVKCQHEVLKKLCKLLQFEIRVGKTFQLLFVQKSLIELIEKVILL